LSSDAQTTSASPDPKRHWGQRAHIPDPCTTLAGTIEFLAPSLEIEGVGPVALPLLPAQAERITGVAEAAPYGRGEETVIDPAVRRCWQIGPDRVRLGGRHWARTLDRIVAQVSEGLGVSDPVTAEFYKLLVYGPGSFFIGHRDTEKAPGMFATLVVVLPSVFVGGDLLVRHRGREARLPLRCDEPAEAAFAAFYADCVHEVLPIIEGHRLTLAYNLVRAGKGRPPTPPEYEEQQGSIAALLQAWRDSRTHPDDDVPQKLVYPLGHAYTPAELGFGALKGADAAAAGVLDAAAQQAHCDLHLALLTVEESGAAEPTDSYGSRRSRWDQGEDAFEAGEVSDRSVELSEWRRPDGKEAVLGAVPVEEDELSPPDACDDLTLDEALARRAVDHLLAWPKTYGLDSVLVPATRALLDAAPLSCAAAIGKLQTACLTHLRARIAEPLAPPADWSRTAAFTCRCPRCSELACFLADPERKTWVLKAAEADRSHVEGTLKGAHCDVDITTDRRGRPYSLVCTKNQASYERRAKQRKKDLENLERLTD